jgi:hypothetical protein
MPLDKNSIKPFLQIYLFENRCQYYKSDSGVSPCKYAYFNLIRFILIENGKMMETERLFECNGLRFGYYSVKPKRTVNDLWINEIQTAWDTLIQKV